jgi:hypothetical protein
MLKNFFKHNFSIGSRSAVGGIPFVVDDSAVAGATDVFASQLLLASLLFLASMPLLASLLLLVTLVQKIFVSNTVMLASLQRLVFSAVAGVSFVAVSQPCCWSSLPVASVVPALLLASLMYYQLPDSLLLPLPLLLQAYLLALASSFYLFFSLRQSL